MWTMTLILCFILVIFTEFTNPGAVSPIVLPNLQQYEGSSGFVFPIPARSIYRVGVVGGWIMGFLENGGRLRPLLAVNPETNHYERIKISKDNPQYVEPVLLGENNIRKHYHHLLSECEGVEVFYAKRPKFGSVVPISDEIQVHFAD